MRTEYYIMNRRDNGWTKVSRIVWKIAGLFVWKGRLAMVTWNGSKEEKQ